MLALCLASAAALATDTAHRIAGSHFQLAGNASSSREGDTLILRRTSSARTLVKYPLYLSAAPYRFAEVAIRGRSHRQRFFFAWKSRTPTNAGIAAEPLPWNGRNRVSIPLPAAWQGSITEIALMITGPAGDRDLEVEEVVLLPAAPETALQARLDRWLNFAPWTQRSINDLSGAPPGDWLSPAAAAGLAALLVVLITAAARALGATRRQATQGLCILLVVLWLLLDGLWQRRLQLQLAVTRATFAGLDVAGRGRADHDAPLFMLAERLAHYLPADPERRVFLLHEAYGHNLARLRLQYHLLPRNIFNFGRKLPKKETFRSGDHVLLLGNVPGVTFDAARGELRDARHTLPASLVTTEGAARLFRLTSAGGATP